MPSTHVNAAAGTITDSPLGTSATTINSAAFANLPTIAAPNFLDITLDPTGVGGLPEIVRITAHTAAATSVTVTRYAQTQTGFLAASGRSHASGTIWRAITTAADFVEAVDNRTRSTNVRLSAGPTITTTPAAISWTTEDADTDGFISAPSTTVTVPSGKDGLYLCTFQATCAGSNTMFGAVTANSVKYPIVESFDGSGAQFYLCTFVAPLAAGNTVSAVMGHPTAGAVISCKLTLVRLSA